MFVPGSMPKIIFSVVVKAVDDYFFFSKKLIECFINLENFSMQQSKTNYSIFGRRIFKFLLAASAFYFVYYKVTNEKDADHYLYELGQAFTQTSTFVYLSIVLMLMFFNWLVEAWKWRLMILKLEPISLSRSLEATLSGLTVSLFTPNRIGEYAGRVFHLNSADKIQATLVTVIENFSQLIVTLLFGAFASVIFFESYTDYPIYFSLLFSVMLFIVAIVSIIGFLNVRLLVKPLSRIKFTEKRKQMFHVLEQYQTIELVKVLAGAILRYAIFTLQFFLLIKMFGGQVEIFPALVMISMTYLVITVVPTFLLTEIGVRGAAAVYFFSMLGNDNVPILNAVFALWIINLALPALIGAVLMVDFKFGKEKAE